MSMHARNPPRSPGTGVPATNAAAAASLVRDAARGGDKRCQKAVEQLTTWLATRLTGPVNLLDSDRIALLGFHRELVRQRHDQLLARSRNHVSASDL
jgi:predicted NBD/HSP70 family sugar kinase